MARQRFIWPDIWKDPTFGRLTDAEQVMFIGLFSIADDVGRTIADPEFLRAELYTYRDTTNKKVRAIRDSVVAKVESVWLYERDGVEYIALTKWSEYQKPKYPKPSKLPPPLPEIGEAFPQNREGFPESGDVGRAGLGRDFKGMGLGNEELLPGKEREVDKILGFCNDVRPDSRGVLLTLAMRCTPAALAKVRESCETRKKEVGVGYAVNALRSELEERVA